MKKTLISLLTITTLVTPTGAVTLLNGSFEDLDASYVNAAGMDLMDNATGTGWSTINSSDWVWSGGPEGLYNTPYDNHFALSGATGAFAGGVYREGVNQVVSGFTVGETYEIGFSHANGLRWNDNSLAWEGVGTIGGWQVLVDSTSLALVASTNDNSTPSAPWTTGWQNSSVTFTATATSHDIRFIAYKPDGTQDPTFQFLDNVDVRLVPEPSMVLLACLAGMLALRRRR